MIDCIIIDDKPLAIDILADYINKVPFLKLAGSFSNPHTAFQYIKEASVDLIFLDIQMPELTGIQFMRILEGKCKVIFVTAYTEYALEGYEHDVIDYLLKPVSFERFYKAAEKARKQCELTSIVLKDVMNAEMPSADTNNLFIKTDYKIVRIAINTILYIEAKQNYISIITNENSVLSLQSIKSIEQRLPNNKFIRIHKSYIVSIDNIDTIEKSSIHIGETTLPVGHNYRDAFFKLLDTKS
jgi:two-component system LytT family response regulator